MNGKTGEAPALLTQMMQEAENVEGLEGAVNKGGLIDKVTSDQRRRVLFLMSFASKSTCSLLVCEPISHFD
jgi:hypothetical protein